MRRSTCLRAGGLADGTVTRRVAGVGYRHVGVVRRRSVHLGAASGRRSQKGRTTENKSRYRGQKLSPLARDAEVRRKCISRQERRGSNVSEDTARRFCPA